jgi:plastocyanin
MLASFLVAALAASGVTAQSSTMAAARPAQTHFVRVGNNQSATNATAVFQPRLVAASVGDTVIFNFTEGNHTANQAMFYAPCIPANQADNRVNGFYSGDRITPNGTTGSQLNVFITPDVENTTLWFFDAGTCFIGGVGGINVNTTSNETLDGFERNARRLNGSRPTSASRSMSRTSGGPSPTDTQSGGGDSSDANRVLVSGAMLVAPMLLAALAL